MALSPEDQKYYEELFDLFSTPGWKHFIEMTQLHKTQLEDMLSVQSIDDLRNRQGQLAYINTILNLKSNVEFTYEELTGNHDSV